MNSLAPQVFRLGVVEGYFGRQWTWQARRDYASFLAACGCNSYMYAPKNDAWLRKQWQLPFPLPHLEALRDLRAHHGAQGLEFGIGLSPFELYRDFSRENRELLRRKLDELNAIAPATLCILFDDMMGDLRELARAQLEIVDFITQHSSAQRFVICPTYYSDDPLLTRHFGAQPEHYLEDIGKGLDARIDVFWTGPQVISSSYPAAHLRQVADKLRRRPLLWDNYPVNDAKRLTPFLHLLPFTGRNSSELRELTSGHLANPMNEAYLSQLPLYTLAELYAGATNNRRQSHDDSDTDYLAADGLFARACSALCPPELADALMEDVDAFQHAGLDNFDAATKERLVEKYSRIAHPMAREVTDWLRGGYVFDPACLT
ncbi:MAG: beta-N-acetylglucosaminidase domain-containing protein [Gammaproteobacteria bacterium]